MRAEWLWIERSYSVTDIDSLAMVRSAPTAGQNSTNNTTGA